MGEMICVRQINKTSLPGTLFGPIDSWSIFVDKEVDPDTKIEIRSQKANLDGSGSTSGSILGH